MKNYTKPAILSGAILFIIFFHIFGYIGHYGYDDLHYAEIAHNLLNGKIDFGDHYVFRVPIIFMTALSYSLFGISDFSSALPSILVSTLILIIVFQVLKKKNVITLILGLSLTILSNPFLSYSDKLMPDIYIVLAIMISLFILHYYNYQTDQSKPFKYGLLFSISLLLGFTTKGTIVLITPLLVFLLVSDLIHKKNTKFWIYSITTGIALLVLYFVFIGVLTGDFLQRFKAISSNSYLNLCSYDQQSTIILLRRIGYKFFQLILNSSLITAFLFLFAYLLAKRSFKVFDLSTSFSFWFSSAIILLFSANFMSISATSYSPMCLDYRHYLYLIPIAAIPASEIIFQFIHEKKYKISIALIFIVTSIISFIVYKNVLWGLYLPLTVIILVYIFTPKLKWIKQLTFITIILTLSIKPLFLINYGNQLNYRGQRSIFEKVILSQKANTLIISDDVQKRLGEYYTLGKNYDHLEFVNYDEYLYDSTDNRQIILYKNWYTNYLTGAKERDLPYYARSISPKNDLLYEDKSLNIKIYRLNQIIIPEINGKIHYQIINGFEKANNYWNQSKKDETIKFEGNYSNLFKEYSASFTYPLDSIDMDPNSKLFIQCKLQINYPDKAETLLVVSVENNGKSLFWSGKPITNFIKAYTKWWPAKHTYIIDKKDIKNNSILKIYIWNKDKKQANIDNFEIKLIELPY